MMMEHIHGTANKIKIATTKPPYTHTTLTMEQHKSTIAPHFHKLILNPSVLQIPLSILTMSL